MNNCITYLVLNIALLGATFTVIPESYRPNALQTIEAALKLCNEIKAARNIKKIEIPFYSYRYRSRVSEINEQMIKLTKMVGIIVTMNQVWFENNSPITKNDLLILLRNTLYDLYIELGCYIKELKKPYPSKKPTY